MTNCTQGVHIPVSGHVTPNPNSHHVHYSFDHLQVICIYTPSVKFQHSSHVRYSFDYLQVICIYTPSIKFQHEEASPDLLLQNIVLHAFYTNAYTPPTQTSTHVGASLVAWVCLRFLWTSLKLWPLKVYYLSHMMQQDLATLSVCIWLVYIIVIITEKKNNINNNIL